MSQQSNITSPFPPEESSLQHISITANEELGLLSTLVLPPPPPHVLLLVVMYYMSSMSMELVLAYILCVVCRVDVVSGAQIYGSPTII